VPGDRGLLAAAQPDERPRQPGREDDGLADALADFMIAGGNQKIKASVHNHDTDYIEDRPEMCVS
jgi:hypothetical protein